jgi:hypothetical protein
MYNVGKVINKHTHTAAGDALQDAMQHKVCALEHSSFSKLTVRSKTGRAKTYTCTCS